MGIRFLVLFLTLGISLCLFFFLLSLGLATRVLLYNGV